MMMQNLEYYIGQFKLDVIPDAYLVEVSFVEEPPRQDRVTDLPHWTFSSRNAIWFFLEDCPYHIRAKNGEKIKSQIQSSLH